ncbi:hypothetical protein [Rhodococcus zopfii]|uniref:hypothetical protein n=1 Tax=Rhodococcus zopfii TaxID=43772 RepID=UPI001EDF2FE9|nr:hypothetical protein [Rhodococcus zopfii]
MPADLDLGKYNQDSGYSRLHAANFDGQEHVVHSNATNPQSADGGSITIGEVTIEGRTPDQIKKDIESKTGVSIGDLSKILDIYPGEGSANWIGDIEAKLEELGVLPPAAGSPPKVDGEDYSGPVLDEVLVPHPYMPGRFISEAQYGPADKIQAAKEAGQEAVREQVLRGLAGGLAGIRTGQDAFGTANRAAAVDHRPAAAQQAPQSGSPNNSEPPGRSGGPPASDPAQAARYRAELASKHLADAERRGVGSDVIRNPMVGGSGLKADIHHRMASYLTEAELASSVVTPIKGADGVSRTLVQVPNYTFEGKSGVVEYIIDKDGAVTHQKFIPGGVIGAGPNRGVNRGM